MNRCMGCKREADRCVRHNNRLFVCTPCATLIPWVKTKVLFQRQCYGCDSTLYHGQLVCWECLDACIDGLACLGRSEGEAPSEGQEERTDETPATPTIPTQPAAPAAPRLNLLDDNPFLYELALGHIRFYQSLSLPSDSWGEDWMANNHGPEPRVITFTNLVYEKAPTMQRKLARPICCRCEEEIRADAYSPEAWPSLNFCYPCIYAIREWMVTNEVAEGNPLFESIGTTEPESAAGRARVWRFGDGVFRETYVPLGRTSGVGKIPENKA